MKVVWEWVWWESGRVKVQNRDVWTMKKSQVSSCCQGKGGENPFILKPLLLIAVCDGILLLFQGICININCFIFVWGYNWSKFADAK